MDASSSEPERDPHVHTRRVRHMLNDIVTHLRQDVGRANDPKAQALFETAAEVLGGLNTAFDHYEQGGEGAWQQGEQVQGQPAAEPARAAMQEHPVYETTDRPEMSHAAFEFHCPECAQHFDDEDDWKAHQALHRVIVE